MSAESPLPPGLYEHLLTQRLADLLERLPGSLRADCAGPAPTEVPALLARHLAEVLGRVLSGVAKDDLRRTAGAEALTTRLAGLCAELLDALNDAAGAEHARLDERLAHPLQQLRAIVATDPTGQAPDRPLVPLNQSALLVNEPGDPSLGESLRRELASADSVDLLCAFINWNGVRLVRGPLEELVQRGGRLRVLTSTYMGVTQRRAVDELCRLGAQVRVAYDREPARTRLHAKAWLIHRESGLPTAYIGSSNLSHSALTDGLEWNVRLSAVDAPSLLMRFRTSFERYWADPTFEPYEPDRDGQRIDAASSRADRISEAADPSCWFDLHPYPHQQQVLEQLELERRVFDRRRNLVVSATGTGKTLIAAFDFQRLRRADPRLKLLFVVHREEILRQARHQFRNVLKDGGFGELWVGGDRPSEWRHVFASVQSLSTGAQLPFGADHFGMVVLDEMHHAPARSYDELLRFLRPGILLGLTATPERADGLDTLRHFDGRISAELRLWDALERQLLAPFHYFGVPDDIDLSGLRWQRGYQTADLEAHYVGQAGQNRVAKILSALGSIVADPNSMKALGFCVSIAHAEFMANRFAQAGLPSLAVTSATSEEERRSAIRSLREGTLRVLFTVDLFNEGVDIPEVDTLLLLRPTESATVFIQQLGRGLRLCEGKSCVTVLDFIGQQHVKFRFDHRYRHLTGLSRRELQSAVEHGFCSLPAGCEIRLERAVREKILSNLRQSIGSASSRQLTAELRTLGDTTLRGFLEETGLEPEDLYKGGRTLTELRRAVGLLPGARPEGEAAAGRGFERLLGFDDPEWVDFCRSGLLQDQPPEPAALTPADARRWRMLVSTVAETELGDDPDPTLALLRLWELNAIRLELAELLQLLRDRSRELTYRLEGEGLGDVPIRIHGTYGRNAIATAFGLSRPSSLREGVRWFPDHQADALFVTLRKGENEYSATTRYNDYVISPDELHWESQSVTRADSPTAERYREHLAKGTHILLFAREQPSRDGRTEPYFFLGPASYLSEESERPIRVRWRLQRPMPERVYERFRAASG